MASGAGEVPAAPAFYALQAGGWRDYLTILHPPYTAWHLSYVAIGWAVAPEVHLDRLWALLAAFFLAVGIGAHCLDELNGRPLRTRIPASVLWSLAVAAVGLAIAIGIEGARRTDWTVLPFVAFGGFIVVAYNLELLGGRFHSDFWFALAWGAFPAFTATWANALELTAPGVLAAAACFMLSVAQRTLSTPVRELRRTTREVEGRVVRADGSVEHVDAAYLRAVPEGALRALSAAMPLLAATAVAVRTLG